MSVCGKLEEGRPMRAYKWCFYVLEMLLVGDVLGGCLMGAGAGLLYFKYFHLL
jgi:hypothetical protein